MSELEKQDVLNLVTKCISESHEAFKEQTQIESPFPGAQGSMLSEPWPIFDEFYRGLHWKRMGRMPSWKSTPKDNRPFQVVENNTTLLTDNRAKAMFLPMEVDDAQLANKVQAAWNFWCSKVAYDINLTLGVKDSRKYGIGWLKLCYDEDLKEQRPEVVPAESIKVDPDTTADMMIAGKEPNYLVYEYIAQLGDLKAQFPKADWENFNPKWTPAANMAFADRIRRFFAWGSSSVENPAVSVPVYEIWIRDDERIVFEEELGDVTLVKRKKKYAGGRRIIVAGGQVLYDGKNPYKHGQMPFTPIFAYPEAGKFYCAGDIENIISPTVMLNRMQQLLFDGTVKQGGGILWVNSRYGVTADMITNAPFQVIETTDVNQAGRFDKFPPIARHIFDYIQVLYRVIDDASGMHDISRGARSQGNPMTAQEVAILAESDRTRIRLASRIIGWANERIARQWLSNQLQWSDWEWFVRVAGEDGTEQTVTINASDFKKPGEDGLASDEDLTFDVIIADSSTLPTYFQDKKQMFLQLFQMGVIDAEALLEALEVPGWRGILARMQQNASEQAAMQAPPADPMAALPPEQPMMPGGEEAMIDDEVPLDPSVIDVVMQMMGV